MIGLESVVALQLPAKLGMIVDLAVEDDSIALVGTEDRLMAAHDVDDAEATHSEAEVAVREVARIVGAAMANSVAGGHQRPLRHRLAAAPIPPSNSAHWFFLASPLNGGGGHERQDR